MPRGQHLRFDRDAFHRYLYDRANSKSEIVVIAREMAALLECQYRTIGVMLEDLAKQGKVEKLGRASRPQGSGSAGYNYRIADPDAVPQPRNHPAAAGAKKGARIIQWG